MKSYLDKSLQRDQRTDRSRPFIVNALYDLVNIFNHFSREDDKRDFKKEKRENR